jgi:NADPH-dependent curcumin reductase CurA
MASAIGPDYAMKFTIETIDGSSQNYKRVEISLKDRFRSKSDRVVALRCDKRNSSTRSTREDPKYGIFEDGTGFYVDQGFRGIFSVDIQPKNGTLMCVEAIPEGVPEAKHFAVTYDDTMLSHANVEEGGILIELLVLSADPYMRGMVKAVNSYTGASPVGLPLKGFAAGRVLHSKSEKWNAGDLFGTSINFTTFQVIDAETLSKSLFWNLTPYISEDQISLGVGILGMPGSTAYGGLIDVLRPELPVDGEEPKDQVIWVSGAAGAVGGYVGMIAKGVYNCKVIGSCGGEAKGKLIKEKFGFDHAVDYKQCEDVEALTAAIKKCAPDGIDMYFENVGGMHFEAAMKSLRAYGRVAVCGGISKYNDGERIPEKFFPTDMIYNFQRVEGFMCMPWLSGAKGSFLADVSKWLKEDKIKVEETFFDGIEAWPEAFAALFTGANTGKVVVRL